jgi:hypothetical protein
METGPLLAIALTLLVHLVAFAVLVATVGDGMMDIFRTKPADDGDGGEPRRDEPIGPEPSGDAPQVPLLPDAAPAPVRLREPGRIAPAYRRERRPVHAPERTPAPEKV